MNETRTQSRLRHAQESLAAFRAKENDLRIALAAAVAATRIAKDKYDALFIADQHEQVEALKRDYRHCTLG